MKSFTQNLILVAAVVLAGCSEKSSQLVPMPVASNESVSQKPTDLVTFNPKVDILFVIDNSGSMQDAQNNLSDNARKFSSAITAMTILDFHIGIISTDMDDCRRGCGNLMGSPYFVDKNTPDAANALARNMILGTSGSAYERMFTPVMAALNNPGYTNAGFYRQDAYLAVIFITDAEEQSNVSPGDFLKYLIAKKGDANKVLAYGAIRKLAEEDICTGEESLDDKLETFLASVVNADKKQNNVLSLCSSDYGIKLSQFANDIVKRSSGTIRLQRVPNTKTIQVTYGTQVIPNSLKEGWVYENSTNSIILASDIKWKEQGPNTQLSVDFEAIEQK